MPVTPDNDGLGEFAVGFDPPSDLEPLAFGDPKPAAALSQAEQLAQVVRNVTAHILDQHIVNCQFDAGNIADCVLGGIDNQIDSIQAVRDKLAGTVESKLESHEQTALTQVLTAIADMPTVTAAITNPKGTGRIFPPIPDLPGDSPTIGGGPDTIGLGTSSIGTGGLTCHDLDPTGRACHDSIGTGTITIGGGGGKDTIGVGGGSPPPPPPPSCFSNPGSPDTCTIGKCVADCTAAGGTWHLDEFTGQYVCTGSSGTSVVCQANDGAACFLSPADCSVFVRNNASLGWVIAYDDPADHDTAYAWNPGLNLRIDCRGECYRQYPKRGPCPKPKESAADAVLVCRPDGWAGYVDPRGTVYGDLCDLRDCQPTTNDASWYMVGFAATVWVDWPDGKCGWMGPNGYIPCDDTQATKVELTLGTVDDWIAEQDSPDDWEVTYDEQENAYYVVNSETDERMLIPDQDKESEPPPPDPDEDESGVIAFDVELPDSDYLFAGRD